MCMHSCPLHNGPNPNICAKTDRGRRIAIDIDFHTFFAEQNWICLKILNIITPAFLIFYVSLFHGPLNIEIEAVQYIFRTARTYG